MEHKKTNEEKLALKYVTEERVQEIIRNFNGYVVGLDVIPIVGDRVFKDILDTEIHGITEILGQRDFSFIIFKKEIIKSVRPFVEDYLVKFNKNKKLNL